MSEDTTTTAPPRLGELVRGRVQRIVAQKDTASGRAVLAHLRDAVGKEPGSDPAIWEITVAGVSPTARTDTPTRHERAAHLALTLFAVHQQSRTETMHRGGVGFGHAVARLDGARPGNTEGTSPVRRRFDAVATAESFNELAHHVRGLVTQLRGEGIGLDYGLLADDLLQYQRNPDVVRRRWGRQLYDTRRTSSQPEASTEIATELTEEQQ